MKANWTLDQLGGFLDTWSAVRRYQVQHGVHPLSLIWPELTSAWGPADQPREICWRLNLRIGMIE